MPNFNFDESAENPQHGHDQILMRKCIGGLIIYAAQCAEDTPDSPKIAEIRSLIESIAAYWNLDEFSPEKLQKDFLLPFDFLTETIKSGASLPGHLKEYNVAVIYGLYRHCEDLVYSQGNEAKDEILSIKKIAVEIDKSWRLALYGKDDLATWPYDVPFDDFDGPVMGGMY